MKHNDALEGEEQIKTSSFVELHAMIETNVEGWGQDGGHLQLCWLAIAKSVTVLQSKK